MTLYACIEVNDSKDIKSTKPVIDKMTANPSSMLINQTSVITVEARDLNGEKITYFWTKPDGGEWVGDVTGSSVTWKAPATITGQTKNFRIVVKVQNENNKYALDTATIVVNSSQIPVVTIIRPLNGAYIALSEGTVNIYAQSSFTDTDSMKCYINGVFHDRVNSNYIYDKNWNISAENEGTKQIQIVAFRPGGYTGSSMVTISLEGTIGKRK